MLGLCLGMIKLADHTCKMLYGISDLSRILNRWSWGEHYYREFNEWYEPEYEEWE